MTKLAFCDYHNMVAILEKTEHNVDFHQIVDFLEASHIRYALMVSPTVYVSHIRQFWSTARVKTVDGETHIIAKVNGKQRDVSESSIWRHLKLNDEEGISTLPDNESWWQSFGVLITLTVSWTYVTVIFLSSCLVFHLVPDLPSASVHSRHLEPVCNSVSDHRI
ncbi:xylulose kinase-1 [Tanacetum coccineum]